jgi:hypothetical protein
MRTAVSMECERTPEHSCMRFCCKRSGRCLVVYCIIRLSASKIYLADPGDHTKAWVCCKSLARIAGLNPTAETWMSLSFEWCVLSSRRLCNDRSLIQKSPTEYGVSVIEEPRREGLGLIRLSNHEYPWIYTPYSVKISRYALSRRLGGHQGWSARCGEEKNSYLHRESNPGPPVTNIK